ncbi:helix-turn-helix transcriptional regulator [Paenibacillus turpanensis]|uniref:helix-turn-helix transcriptional regulator n=1 Tax=Paenibacillus turpanensis TaxID=2689078 RepID=UPI00140E81D4|nr:YafY family protein [Paenibacillus turpanensis]
MKLDRLLAITMLLLNRRRVSAKELSDRFEVSLRTVYRDVEAITQAGIPVVSYPGSCGGYEIMEQYRLDRQYLSSEELQSIVIALKGVAPTLEEEQIGTLLDKVGALLSRTEHNKGSELQQQLYIDIHPWRDGSHEKEVLATLKNAIRSSRFVRFSYTNSDGRGSDRSCEPMGIVLKGYLWYLFGYCLLRNEFRIFRLSRIERLELLTDSFQRRPFNMDQLRLRWAGDHSKDCIRLTLRFKPEAKSKVFDYFPHEHVSVQTDGSLLVKTSQPDEPWLYGMLLSYGATVKVLEPDSVAQTLLQKIDEIISLYNKP